MSFARKNLAYVVRTTNDKYDWICGKGYKYYDFDLKFKKSTEEDYKTSLQLAFNERSKVRE